MARFTDDSQVLEAFQDVDTNNSGFITFKELAAVIRKLAPDGTAIGQEGEGERIDWTKADIEIVFNAMDQDGDGKVYFEEFIGWVFGDKQKLQRSTSGQAAMTPRGLKQEMIKRTSTAATSVADEDGEDEDEDDEDEEDDEGDKEKMLCRLARNLLFINLMPAEEGTARAAAAAMKTLPAPDSKFKDDCKHVELYLKHFTDDRHLDGKTPAGAKRKNALRWLYAALDRYSEGDKQYQLPIKFLLGSWRLWPENDDPNEKEFLKLKKFAEKKLDVIGVDYERDVFVGLGIGGILGKLGSEVKPQRPRQDQYLPMPSKFEPVYDFKELDEEDLDAAGKEALKKEQMDEFYIALLLTAVHAVDPLFQEEASRICESAGGECKGPAPKGFMRMWAKMSTDHAEADTPKPAENVDTNRAAWIFEKPEDLARAYHSAAGVWGTPLRVKNGCSPDFNALQISKGYRNVLCNYHYNPQGLTWGALIAKDGGKVLTLWDRLRQKVLQTFLRTGYADEESLDKEWRQYLNWFDVARKTVCSAEMRNTKVELVVEIQYMLRQYMNMRKKTHAWYKIVRADNAEAMVFDYVTV